MASTAEDVIGLLIERGLTLAVAESSTGGLIGHLLTEAPGSSRAFLGGVVAYHNSAKTAILGVDRTLIEGEGAVSDTVARAMAEGVRRLFGADLAVAVTGIAGPAGGTPEKPVGLTYVALADGTSTRCHRHVWGGTRDENKRRSAEAALALLLDHLLKTEGPAGL